MINDVFSSFYNQNIFNHSNMEKVIPFRRSHNYFSYRPAFEYSLRSTESSGNTITVGSVGNHTMHDQRSITPLKHRNGVATQKNAFYELSTMKHLGSNNNEINSRQGRILKIASF